MNPPERTQVETDTEREYYGQLTLIVCTKEEDKTRQEFKKEADVNELMKRFGAVPPSRVPGGEWDFNLDLATAFDAVRTVRDGFRSLPADLREIYKTPQDLIDAVIRGEVTYKSEEAAAGSSGAAEADSATPKAARAKVVDYATQQPPMSFEDMNKAFNQWLKEQKAAPEKA